MKKVFISCIFLLGSLSAQAQFGQLVKKLGNAAKSTSESKATNKVSETVGKGIDGITKKKTKSDKNATDASDSESSTVKKKGIKSYSRFDFVPGEKVVYAEDFSKDAIGEMPLQWMTNGKGELMELDGVPGKWLRGFKNSELTSMSKKIAIDFLDLITNFYLS